MQERDSLVSVFHALKESLSLDNTKARSDDSDQQQLKKRMDAIAISNETPRSESVNNGSANGPKTDSMSAAVSGGSAPNASAKTDGLLPAELISETNAWK